MQSHLIRQDDISLIVSAFAAHNWPKPKSTFEKYLTEQQVGERVVWVAYEADQLAGYITLKWQSQYPSFNTQNIPEIMDLNVLPPFRSKGIGQALLELAEKEANIRSDSVGLGVGLYVDYGAAQRLYIKRGYIPDGLGVTYNYKYIEPGEKVPLDDELVLWFTKQLV